MIYDTVPLDFDPEVEVSACFIEHGGEIILLHRQDHKKYGNTWGVPAGKLEPGESPLEAAVRETEEETGLVFDLHDLHFYDSLAVNYPDTDFMYHMFHVRIPFKLPLLIDVNSHKNYKWVTPSDALKMPLILDEDECIRRFYGL